MTPFAAGGAVEGMWEEIIALVPVLLLLARRVGFDALTVVSMSLGAAGIGSTFSPFAVVVARPHVPLLASRCACESATIMAWRVECARATGFPAKLGDPLRCKPPRSRTMTNSPDAVNRHVRN